MGQRPAPSCRRSHLSPLIRALGIGSKEIQKRLVRCWRGTPESCRTATAQPPNRAADASRAADRLEHAGETTPAPPSLPYKADVSRPSPRTNWTRLVPPPVGRDKSGNAPPASSARACDIAAMGAGGRMRIPRLQGSSGSRSGAGAARHCASSPPPRTKWTRRVPHPVLIGHAASLTPY